MSKPLAGIRVIELANFIAGPLCGTLLADMGADVVKVEPPKGDMSRATPPIRNGESVSFVALNRNKRSLVLDLKNPQAQEVMRKLAAQSDVFVEANRPGALDKMGLGAEHLKAVNPKLIYTSVSGFGQTGPDRRRAGVNLIIEAFSGVLSVTGEPGKMPMRPGVQTADVFGALFATYATLGEPGRRGARNGEGRIADISLVEASIAAAAWEAAEYLETGKVPQPMGNRHRLTAPYQLFETSDKRYVAIGMPNNMLFQKFMQVIGLGAHLADPRFVTYANRKANEDPLLALVEPAIRKMNSGELEAGLMEAGVPCALVNNFEEVFEHPQIVARGVVQEIEHPRLGTMKVTRNPVLLDHDGPDIARPAPMLGEHSEEILRELGYDQAAIQEAGVGGRHQARGGGAAEGHGGGIAGIIHAPAPQLSLRPGQPRKISRQGDGAAGGRLHPRSRGFGAGAGEGKRPRRREGIRAEDRRPSGLGARQRAGDGPGRSRSRRGDRHRRGIAGIFLPKVETRDDVLRWDARSRRWRRRAASPSARRGSCCRSKARWACSTPTTCRSRRRAWRRCPSAARRTAISTPISAAPGRATGRR